MKGADKFILVAGSITLLLAIYLFIFPGSRLAIFIENASSGLSSFGENNWVWVSFMLSTFGNTSVLIVFPYALIVGQIAGNFVAWGYPIYYPLLLGILSGMGAGVGEISSYLVGRLFTKSDKLTNSELGKKFERMRKQFEERPKSIPFIIFLFALTPLPDDAILVPFGIMKYSYRKTIIPCMLGKMVLCIGLSYLGYYIEFFGETNDLLNAIGAILLTGGNPAMDMVNLFVMFFVVYLMFRLDFEKLMSRGKKGDGDGSTPALLFKCEVCGWETDDINTNFCGECGRPVTGMEPVIAPGLETGGDSG
ncbi:MAG: VTT domain-containing protein [Promethearchaeota archaeon]